MTGSAGNCPTGSNVRGLDGGTLTAPAARAHDMGGSARRYTGRFLGIYCQVVKPIDNVFGEPPEMPLTRNCEIRPSFVRTQT